MPSDQSTWLIAIPQDGDAEGTLQQLHSKLAVQSKTAPSISQLPIPSFKVLLVLRESVLLLGYHLTRSPKDRNIGVSDFAL